jgi:hypothetical protein
MNPRSGHDQSIEMCSTNLVIRQTNTLFSLTEDELVYYIVLGKCYMEVVHCRHKKFQGLGFNAVEKY